jgi:hypothetical protein
MVRCIFLDTALVEGFANGPMPSSEGPRYLRRPDAYVSPDPHHDEPRTPLRNAKVGEVDDLGRDLISRTDTVVKELARRSESMAHKQPCLAVVRGQKARNIFQHESDRLPLVKEASDLPK